MMLRVIKINRGGDLRASGAITAEGQPVNLTGATLTLVSTSPELAASVTVTDAAQGQILIAADWSDAWPAGRRMSFYVRIDRGGVSQSWPQTWVEVA